MLRVHVVSVLALSLPVWPAAAQEQATSRFEQARTKAPPVTERVEPFAFPGLPERPGAEGPARAAHDPGAVGLRAPGSPARPAPGPASGTGGDGFSWRGLAHAVGGALVGGWLGYVGSQMIKDDWEKDSNASFRSHRSLMAAAGALAGIFGSRLIGSTASPDRRLAPAEHRRRDRVLTLEEIRGSDAPNAYELISTLRGHWLVVRGLHSHTEAAQGYGRGGEFVVRPGAEKILVYMNDVRLGGVQAMREVPADLLTSAAFLDAREATYRFGSGHTHGAIVLSTEVTAP